MKKALSILLVLAMVLSMSVAAFADEGSSSTVTLFSGTDVPVSDDVDNPDVTHTWTATADGTVEITMSGDPGWEYCLEDANGSTWVSCEYPDQNIPISVSADDTIKLSFFAYDPTLTGWKEVSGTVSYTVTFTPSGESSGGGDETPDVPDSWENAAEVNPLYFKYTVPAGATYWFLYDGYDDLYNAGIYQKLLTASLVDNTLAETNTISYTVGQSGTSFDCDANGIAEDLIQTMVGTYYFTITNNSSIDLELRISITDKPDHVIDFGEVYRIESEKTYDLDTGFNYDTVIFRFEPTEPGKYQFETAEGVVLTYWGTNGFYNLTEGEASNVLVVNQPEANKDLDGDGNWLGTYSPYIYLGVSGDGICSVKVTRIGNADGYAEPVDVEYENKADVKPFTVPAHATLGDYVDVFSETTHTAVLGTDGYYHLDKADGPILLVDLDYLDYRLTDALYEGRGTMYAYKYDENGKVLTDEDGNEIRYDIANACLAYNKAADSNGYYPLTEDLIFFYKEYAKAQGVYSWALGTDDYNEDCVWMYACRTMTLGEHSYGEWTQTKAPTCTAKGEETRTCDCGASETREVAALGHSYETAWSKGEDGHWHACSVCGDKKDSAAHDFGTKGDACVICGYERDHVHRLTLVPAKDATCTAAGNKAYYTCSGCDDWFEDSAGKTKIEDHSSVVIAALGHTWMDATYDAPKTCKVCGATEGKALTRPSVEVSAPEDVKIETPEDSKIDTEKVEEAVNSVISSAGEIKQPEDTGIDANTSVIEAAKEEIKDEDGNTVTGESYETSLSISMGTVQVDTEDDKTVVTKITYEVTPYLYALASDGTVLGSVELHKFDTAVTFRLPVDKNTTADSAKVFHDGKEMGVFPIKTDENGNKYVEVQSTEFSEFSVELHYHTFVEGVCACGEKDPSYNPVTGDSFNVALMGAVILVSAMSVVALVASKKKFF